MRQMTANTRTLLFYDPIEKIDRFDILISDPHQGGEETTITGTTNLSLQEVWDWLSRGGDWSFTVTAHNCPEKIFISGLLRYQSIRAAVDGQVLCSLCSATEDDIGDLVEKAHKRVLSEIAALQRLPST